LALLTVGSDPIFGSSLADKLTGLDASDLIFGTQDYLNHQAMQYF
jgi:hypothetical protein